MIGFYSQYIFPFIKRITDLVISFFLIVLLSPILILIAILVFIDTKKSPIFIQKRSLSLYSKKFYIYKFRTLKEETKPLFSGLKILFKPHLEDKISPLGKFLRKTGLDELPQLLNIIKGEMSIVGPRPLSLEDLEEIAKRNPEYHLRRSLIKSKPGLTGLWQTTKNSDSEIDYLIFIDEYYEKEKGFLLDSYIILNTIKVLIFAKHRDSILSNEGSSYISQSFEFHPSISTIFKILIIISILGLIWKIN